MCPLLDLAPPFENSCTLPSPDYTFNSARPSPTPSEILGLASEIQENRECTSVTPDTEAGEQTINAATDRAVGSPGSSKKTEGLPRKGSIFIKQINCKCMFRKVVNKVLVQATYGSFVHEHCYTSINYTVTHSYWHSIAHCL